MGFVRLRLTPSLRLAVAAVCAIGLALGAPSAHAANYLVKDKNAFREAVKRLEPGDTLVMGKGVWRDFEMVFEAYGEEGAPISLMAEKPGEVIISGRSNLRIGGEHLIVSGLTFKDGYSPTKEVISFRRDSKTLANNSRLVQTVIVDFNKPDRESDDHWIALFGRNNRVDHNYLAGKTNKGPTLVVRLNTPESQENGHVIDHNFFGRRPPLGGNGGETIRVGVSQYSRTQSQTIIARNYFEHCDGEVEIISNKSEGNTIAENVFYESRGAVVLRHGGGNVVSRNVFFGNGVSDTGGVRVINENQEVVGNYFEGLRGRKFLSALTVMNGVPNSPENRYHQVKNARIANNSFVDVSQIGFGVGSDEERSARPVDSAFVNNMIVSDAPAPVAVFDDISGLSFDGNLSDHAAFAPYGAEIDEGLALTRAENGLLYPEDETRYGDVGAPRDLNPVKRSATGPPWYEKPAQGSMPLREVKVGKGAAALRKAVANAEPGDVLVLSGARYELDAPIEVSRPLSLRGGRKKGRSVTLAGVGAAAFEVKAGGDLSLENLRLEAGKDAGAFISATGEIYEGAYRLTLEDIAVIQQDDAGPAPFLRADPATFAEFISLKKVSARSWRGPFMSLSGEGLDGWYLADDVVIADSEFYDIGGPLATFGREGRDESTFGPRFSLINTSLSGVAKDGAALRLDGVDSLAMEGNVIRDSGGVHIRQRVLGLGFIYAGNTVSNAPEPVILGVDGEAMSDAALGGGR